MWNKLPCNKNVLNSNLSNRISIIASFVEQLSIVKVDSLRSMFQSNKHSDTSSESNPPLCGCDTYANLVLSDANNILELNSYVKQLIIKEINMIIKLPQKPTL